MGEWVNVENGLPNMGIIVLTLSRNYGVLPQKRSSTQIVGNHRVGYYWVGPGPFQNFAHDVTHWMPLPEPPKQ